MPQFFFLRELKRNKFVCSNDKLVNCLQDRETGSLSAPPQIYLSGKIEKADLFSYVEARKAKILVHNILRTRSWEGRFHFKIVKVKFK